MHNNRNHRKIAVVDGKVAYTGGVNIADEYINERVRFGHWKDGGVRIFGDAAEGFVKLFLCDYDLTVSDTSDYSYFLSGANDDREHVKRFLNQPYAAKENQGFYIPFGCGPMPIYSDSVAKGAFLGIINRAERYVYITTPYLIVDFDLTEALRGAAKRGVDVRIITPAIADKPTVKIMTKSSYPYLLEAGVKIFEYTPGFIHEKLLLSDDLYAVVGTINMDYRSLVHHFECGVWIYGADVISDMRKGIEKTLDVSCEIDKAHSALSPKERITRSLVRIFAPLL
jgi:cardiolipin synthase